MTNPDAVTAPTNPSPIHTAIDAAVERREREFPIAADLLAEPQLLEQARRSFQLARADVESR